MPVRPSRPAPAAPPDSPSPAPSPPSRRPRAQVGGVPPAGGPRQERRQRAPQPDEPADDDRPPAVALEIPLHRLQPLLRYPQLRPVPEREVASQLATDPKARRVAGEGADP